MGSFEAARNRSRNERVFLPPEGTHPQDITEYDHARGLSFLKGPGTFKDTSIVIATDGGCRSDWRSGNTISSYGIFFGKDSPYNRASLVPTIEDQTSVTAELYAAMEALRAVRKGEVILNRSTTIIIQTDSQIMVRSMSEFIQKWAVNGYRTTKGDFIANLMLIVKLESMIKMLKFLGDFQVQFWHVPREFNVEADRLASLAYMPRNRSNSLTDLTRVTTVHTFLATIQGMHIMNQEYIRNVELLRRAQDEEYDRSFQLLLKQFKMQNQHLVSEELLVNLA